MREELVTHRTAHSGSRGEHERGRERVSRGGDDLLVEVGERNDEADVVLGDERPERADVARIVDSWHERAMVRVVEGRRERVEVGGDGGRARPPERAHDVDALAGASEEDGRHDG